MGWKRGRWRGTIALELFLTALCNNPPIWARSDQLKSLKWIWRGVNRIYFQHSNRALTQGKRSAYAGFTSPKQVTQIVRERCVSGSPWPVIHTQPLCKRGETLNISKSTRPLWWGSRRERSNTPRLKEREGKRKGERRTRKRHQESAKKRERSVKHRCGTLKSRLCLTLICH